VKHTTCIALPHYGLPDDGTHHLALCWHPGAELKVSTKLVETCACCVAVVEHVQLHIIAFVLTTLLLGVYLLFMWWPFLKVSEPLKAKIQMLPPINLPPTGTSPPVPIPQPGHDLSCLRDQEKLWMPQKDCGRSCILHQPPC
jgi:hypothetical protein